MKFSDFLMEEWDSEYKTPNSKQGMFDGKGADELHAELATLKKSGPHARGSAEYTREKELNFALRAKRHWN